MKTTKTNTETTADTMNKREYANQRISAIACANSGRYTEELHYWRWYKAGANWKLRGGIPDRIHHEIAAMSESNNITVKARSRAYLDGAGVEDHAEHLRQLDSLNRAAMLGIIINEN